MNDILNKSTVLVLNRNWQAIHVKTPAEAFCMMATGAATGLDVQGDDSISPVRWDDWLKLPVREQDNAVNTPRGPVRVPTVIVAANYAKVPLCRPRFGARGIWERDGGVCQYTGRKLAPKRRQHRPRRPAFARRQRRRGTTACSSHREVNSRKGRPPASRSRPAPAAQTAHATRAACHASDPQPPRDPGLAAFPRAVRRARGLIALLFGFTRHMVGVQSRDGRRSENLFGSSSGDFSEIF